MSAVYCRRDDRGAGVYRRSISTRLSPGAGDAINNVVKYLGPGLQLVSFDPKTSFPCGSRAFASGETLDIAADLASADVMVLNQEPASQAEFIYVEGDHSRLTAQRKVTQAHRRTRSCIGDARPLDMTCASRSRR